MPPARVRLVRKEPLMTRLKNYLNPWDFLLWASEELNSNDLEDIYKQWSIPIAILLNSVFMIARANSGGERGSSGDDVFGDYHERRGSGWLVWFASFIVHCLTLVSVLNAIYTFTRKRHYRLFEANIDATPSTPSAKRVNVDSSPLSSSPLRYISHVLGANSAEARAHPDATRDVWEIAVWDPTPLCLRLFTMFSPGHVLVYWLFLPLAPLDPRPSVTVVTTICLAALLTAQLTLFSTFFSQQSKDSAMIYKQVQNEYDTKYVHPTLNKRVRDVGTQVASDDLPDLREVETYTPVTFVSRGFRPNPNPNYAPLYDPEGFLQAQKRENSRTLTEGTNTPVFKTPNPSRTLNTPLRTATTSTMRQPQFRASGMQAGGDGGSFGIHSHAQSPLRKSTASGLASGVSRREGSPLKRNSTPGAPLEAVPSLLHNRHSLLKGDGTRRL